MKRGRVAKDEGQEEVPAKKVTAGKKATSSPAKKKAKTTKAENSAAGKKKKTQVAKKAKKKTTNKKKKSEAATAPVEEWKELSWHHGSVLPVSRLLAHCKARDKKGEGYVTVQQFKHILSGTLPMAEFSGDIESMVRQVESLVRPGFVPYTLFSAAMVASTPLRDNDPVEIFMRQLRTNPKNVTPEHIEEIREDERHMEKLKDQHPLHALVKKDFSADAAAILLSMGVPVDDQINTSKETAFVLACKKKDLVAARWLLDHGADINAPTSGGVTALFTACSAADLDIVRLLLEYRTQGGSPDDQPLVNVNTTTEIRGTKPHLTGGESPLVAAIRACDWLSVPEVQKRKADHEKKSEDSMESEAQSDDYEYLATDKETIVSLLLPHVDDINRATADNHSPISLAVQKANAYVVQKILQTFADTIQVDVVDNRKQPLLHAAVGLNVFAYDITKMLANTKGCKIDAVDESGKTALYLACESNNTEAALALLQAGANPSLASKQQQPLHFAARYHNAYLAHHLIEAGADVNAVDEDGRSALHLVFVGQLSHRAATEQTVASVPVHLRSSLKNCLKLFSVRGAKIERKDVLGNSPLAYALVHGHLGVLTTLFDLASPKNANLLERVSYGLVMPPKPDGQESDYDDYVHGSEEFRKPDDGMSAEDRTRLVQINKWKKKMKDYRRRERAYSSFRDLAGMCALHFAVTQGKLELVREIISRFGDPREIDTVATGNGDTPLLLACRKQDTRMMELLLKNHADVNIANAKKQSPLHAVLEAKSGDPIASISLLCDVEGVLIDNPDSSGCTPLARAAQAGAVMSSLCLLNHGANIDAANHLGNTPLVQALSESHVTYGALLMQKGASLNTLVTVQNTLSKWIPSKRTTQQIIKKESSTLFDFAAARNYEGLCFLMLDIGMAGPQLFAAFKHLMETGKYPLAQVLIKKYSGSEARRTELRKLDVHALVGVISGLKVSDNDERYQEWWQELADRLLELAPLDATLVPNAASNAKLPTLLAAEANHPRVLKYLIQRGLDLTVSGKDSETLLHIAARKNLPQVITAVIGDKAPTDDTSKDEMDVQEAGDGDDDDEDERNRNREEAFHARNRKKLTAIINARNSAQQTALIRATHTHSFASYRNDKLLAALLEIKGIDVDSKDAKGNTALFYAVKTSADKCVQVLLDHGASPCERGETAVFVAARNNSYEIMQALLAKGADPHSVNAKGERLLALCKPLSAVALYHFVRSSSSTSSSSSSPLSLVTLFPEFEVKESEQADDVLSQLVGFIELVNEGLQFYPDRRQPLEELKDLAVGYISGDKKQRHRIPRDVLQNSKQLSFSSLSQEELAELKKKRKSGKKGADEAEAEEDVYDEGESSAKKAKVANANGDKKEKKGDEEEEEEVIEEPDIEIGDDIEQIAFPPPKKWTVKKAQRFVDDEFKRRHRVEASRVYLLWDTGKSEDEDDSEQENGKAKEKSAHEEDDQGYLYDAKLNLCDISFGTYGHNKYYIIQAFGHRTKPDTFYLWTRWARVGSYSFESQLQSYSTKEEAVQAFQQKFRDKTKNNWADRADFQQAHDRYFYIPATHEIEEDPTTQDNSDDDSDGKVDPACNLPGSVQSLLHLISNRKEFTHTYAAYGLRTAGLGSLTSGQIRNGFKLLKLISGIITYIDKKNSKGQPVLPRFRSALVELSNKYYSIIPYNFGRQLPDVISQTSQVSDQMRILESLADIDLGVQILSEAEKEKGLAQGHVLERLYAALHTQLAPVDKNSDEWLVVNEFMSTSGLTVMDAFSVEREGEAMRFRPFSHLPNRMLLAHGTRISNTMGILRQGLRIAPPEAPHCGFMFGKGIYFADVAEKSAGYCGLGQGEIGVFFLCEVALGNQYNCYQANYIEVLPKGKHSTQGCGRTVPSPPACIYTDEGVKIPLGREAVNAEEDPTPRRLAYNEHIVYNEGQVRIRYILKVRRG